MRALSRRVTRIVPCGFGTRGVAVRGGRDALARAWRRAVWRDARVGAGEAAVKTTLAAHGAWVAAVAWSPSSEFHIVSAAHGECVRACHAEPLLLWLDVNDAARRKQTEL